MGLSEKTRMGSAALWFDHTSIKGLIPAFSLQFCGDFELDVMREKAELCAKRRKHAKV